MERDTDCALELKDAYAQTQKYAEDLNMIIRKLKESHLELEMAYVDTVNRLAQAIEYKDEETGHHVSRISFFSAIIANAIALPNDQVLRIYNSAAMHDVGKISIPDAVLLKPGKLTTEEFALMKTHTTVGAKLLSNSNSKLLETGKTIALTHHERWDGNGYPQGLAGEDIPIEGRIVCLVDVYDALRSDRPYKRAYSQEKTIQIIKEGKGTLFDPVIVNAFFANQSRFEIIDEELRTSSSIDIINLFKKVIPECDITAYATISALL